MKRALDIAISFCLLVAASPVLLACMFLVWRQDGHSPFYIPKRVGKDEKDFPMVKLRSMVVNADRTGVDSTAATDMRITPGRPFHPPLQDRRAGADVERAAWAT